MSVSSCQFLVLRGTLLMKIIHLMQNVWLLVRILIFFGCLEVLPDDAGGSESSDGVSTPRYRVAHFEANFGVTVENDQVSSWLSRPDIFGNVINLTSSSGPSLIEGVNTFYDKNVIRFSATGDFLNNSSFSRLTRSSSYTRVMVLKANNLSNVMSPLSDYSTGEHFTFGSE